MNRRNVLWMLATGVPVLLGGTFAVVQAGAAIGPAACCSPDCCPPDGCPPGCCDEGAAVKPTERRGECCPPSCCEPAKK